MAPEREKLIQYIVDIRAIGNYDYTKAGRSGEVAAKQVRQVIEQHIEHSRLDKHAVLAQRVSEDGKSGPWLLIGESDGVTFLKKDSDELQVNNARLAPVPRDEYPCRCIDPRAIGLLTHYDMMVHTSLETLLGNMLREPTASVRVTRDKDLIKLDKKSLGYVFDASRSFWPIEMRFEPSMTKLHWKTEVEQVEGLDLPVKASLKLDIKPGDTRSVEFVMSWQSVNKPVTIGMAALPRMRDLVERK